MSLLLKGELFFPSPTMFNDPFDSIVPFEIVGTEDEINEAIKEDIDRRYPQLPEEKRKELVDKYCKEQNYKDQSQLFQTHLDRREKIYGVCSFSEEANNPLLWAHYADSHEGICIGIDTDEIINQPYFPYGELIIIIRGQVTYHKAWPVLPYHIIPNSRDNRTTEELQESFIQPLLVKPDNWEYEKEWRLLSLGANNYKIRIEPSAIREVVMGLKMPLEKKREVVKICREIYPHVDIYEAYMSKGNYGIEFKPV